MKYSYILPIITHGLLIHTPFNMLIGRLRIVSKSVQYFFEEKEIDAYVLLQENPGSLASTGVAANEA